MGAVDYDDDIDFFRFKASGDRATNIDVALGTLDDSIVDLQRLYRLGSFLDTNDDYGSIPDGLAPLLGSSQFRRAATF